jgi:hypothetical protein
MTNKRHKGQKGGRKGDGSFLSPSGQKGDGSFVSSSGEKRNGSFMPSFVSQVIDRMGAALHLCFSYLSCAEGSR